MIKNCFAIKRPSRKGEYINKSTFLPDKNINNKNDGNKYNFD